MGKTTPDIHGRNAHIKAGGTYSEYHTVFGTFRTYQKLVPVSVFVEGIPTYLPSLFLLVAIDMTTFKLMHEHVPLSQFAVTDCLHDGIRINDVEIAAVANQQTGITKLVDDARCPVCRIQDRFQGILVEYRLVTSGTF